MDSDKLQPGKNGKGAGAPKRRVSALQKVAGSLPAGSDVGSSLDDFIATANQTLTDTDAFRLTSDITGETRAAKEKKAKEEAAAAEAVAAQSAADLARAAAEEAARKVLAEVTRKSAQQMAQLEAKLADAEARASSAERRVRPPRAPSDLPPIQLEEGADFAEGSYSKPFGRIDADLLRRRRAGVLKGVLIATGAAVVAGGVFFAGNGRLWNKDDAPATAKAEPAKTADAPAPAPAVASDAKPDVATAAPPTVSALPAAAPQPTAEPIAEAPAPEPKTAPSVAVLPDTPAPAPAAATPAAPPPPEAAPPPAAPIVSALTPTAPTVTRLDDEPSDQATPARAKKSSNTKKKTRSAGKPKKVTARSASSGKPSGGIVDPFAQ